MYRVIKVLNNNGVLALDMEKKQEVILLGNGVGFGKKMGQRFGGSPDARRYELVKKETSALQAVNGIDPVYIEVTARIIEAAEGLLGPIRHDILIAMADHIALAVSRAKEGCELPNPFSQDIRALFSQEYEAALKGRELIRQELGVEISEDEVSYITLHIHGGLSDENVSQSLELARLVQDGIRQVEEGMGMNLPVASLGYNRLMSHLRYMIDLQRGAGPDSPVFRPGFKRHLSGGNRADCAGLFESAHQRLESGISLRDSVHGRCQRTLCAGGVQLPG